MEMDGWRREMDYLVDAAGLRWMWAASNRRNWREMGKVQQRSPCGWFDHDHNKIQMILNNSKWSFLLVKLSTLIGEMHVRNDISKPWIGFIVNKGKYRKEDFHKYAK